MIHLNRSEHDFGVVQPASVYNVVVSSDKKIAKVVPGCGCTSVRVKGNDLYVKLTTPAWPFQLPSNYLTLNKKIEVKFIDGSKEEFKVKATMIKPK